MPRIPIARAVVLAVVAVVAVLPTALTGCQGKAPAGTLSEDQQVAVAFSGKTTQGEDVALEDYRGKVVLVNVWATWCAPCRKELPELQKMHHAFGPDFTVLGVSVDKPRAHRNVLGLMGQFGIDYPVVLDPDGASVVAFGVGGYPTTVLVDRNGVVRWRREGIIRPGDTEAEAAIKAALEG